LESGLERLFSTCPPTALRQVLFEQKGRCRWKIYVESMSGFDEGVAAALKAMVLNVMGAACEVEIERVSCVPREKSGKLKYFQKKFSQPAATDSMQPLQSISSAWEN
jgi:hypothetical protein